VTSKVVECNPENGKSHSEKMAGAPKQKSSASED